MTKRVKRLNLIFDAEDANAFRTRLNRARLLRDRHERTLRYTAAASTMFEYTNDDLCDRPEFRAKIEKSCDGCRRNLTKASTAPPDRVQAFWAENLAVYRLAHKRSYLDLALRDEHKRLRLSAAGVEPPSDFNEPINSRGCAPAGSVGRVAIGGPGHRHYWNTHGDAGTFAIVAEEIATLLPDADDDFLAAHKSYYAGCDVRFETLVDVEAPEGLPDAPVTLDAFEKKQRAQLTRVSERMRGECVITAVNILRDLEADEALKGGGRRSGSAGTETRQAHAC